jgi:uncharacterized protein (DUF169 family)
MEKVRQLEEKIGGRWTGIKFNSNGIPSGNLSKTPMRLCEAITKSSIEPITLTKDLVNCSGALRSLNWKTNEDEKISHKIASATGAKDDIVQKLISGTPHINGKIDSITIGIYDFPDVVVSYIQPCAAMRLVRQWQQIHGTDLDFKVSSVMAVCGSVVARAHVANEICLSFGCPDSRAYGAIGKDRLVIGVPVHLLDDLL